MASSESNLPLSHHDIARFEVEVKELVPVQVVNPSGDVASVLQRVAVGDYLRAKNANQAGP